MLKRQSWTREDDTVLRQIYPDLSDSDVAWQMQRTLWSIQSHARRLHLTKNADYRTALNQAHGQRLRNINLSYRVDHNYFSSITTREKAYWLGWIWSDGYVRQQGESYQIELELHKDDVNILEQFKVAVDADYPIRFRRDSARLCIISRQMFQDLGDEQDGTASGADPSALTIASTARGASPPSTRSRWEAKARIFMQLQQVLPLTAVVVEDVQAVTRTGRGGKWNAAFSPVQVGKEHLYRLLREMGLAVHAREGWQTKALREKLGLKKTKSKSKQSFESHAVDAWAMAASVSGAEKPTCARVWYVIPARLHRRQLHRLQASKGGIRKHYGGTRSLGLKRGTVVRHTKYGLCTVGGVDRKRNTISLHDYQTNKRLTQGAKVEACRILTWVAFRSWLVKEQGKRKGKGSHQTPAPNKERLFPPIA